MNNAVVKVDEPVNGWGYRPHLDGMRAVAVYLVVLFHSGSSRFSGGFVGVDLFFVLSGFLVTNVLLADAAKGKIGFARFYARRARRLIPAASVAIVGVCLTAFWVSTPLDRANIVPDARASSLWYANWHFIASSSNYFAADDLESPLLHFWSLAIEEQFYLVFPVVLYAAIRFSRGRMKWVAGVLGGLFACGLVAQLWWARVDTNHAYLGTDARVYQPLAGVLLAVVLWKVRLPERLRTLGEVLFGGSILALVALAVVASQMAASPRGVLAATVAVLAILGSELSPTGRVAQALSWRPVRYLGGISYGTYLWHWPVVAFGHRLLAIAPPAMFAFSAVLGTAMAALSFEILEQPVRNAAWLRAHSRSSVAIGVAAALIVGLVVSPWILGQQARAQVEPLKSRTVVVAEGTTPVPDLDWTAIKDDIAPQPDCMKPDASDCLLRSGSGRTVFLVGDSHARMWSAAFMVLAEKYDWTLYLGASAGCPWPNGIFLAEQGGVKSENCVDFRPVTYQQLDAVEPDLIVLAERGIDRNRAKRLRSFSDAYEGISKKQRLLRQASVDSAGAIDRPGREILLIEPVPVLKENPLTCLSGAEFVEECAFAPVADFFEDGIYQEIAKGKPQIATLSLDSDICGAVCPAMVGETVVRRDKSHLTTAYAEQLADRFDQAIQKLDAATTN